jgi:hypothetical protein
MSVTEWLPGRVEQPTGSPLPPHIMQMDTEMAQPNMSKSEAVVIMSLVAASLWLR